MTTHSHTAQRYPGRKIAHNRKDKNEMKENKKKQAMTKTRIKLNDNTRVKRQLF